MSGERPEADRCRCWKCPAGGSRPPGCCCLEDDAGRASPEVVPNSRASHGASSQRAEAQRQRRHQRRVHHHPAGQGEVLHLGSREDPGSGMERGGLLRAARITHAGEPRQIHPVPDCHAQVAGGAGQVFGPGGDQPE